MKAAYLSMPFRWGDSRCSVWKTPGWQVQEGPSLWGAQTLTCSQLSYQFTLATSSCPGVGTLGKCKLRGINWGGGDRVLVFLYKQELLSLLINSPSVSLRPSSSVILLGYVIGNIALFFFFFKSFRLTKMLSFEKFSQMCYLEHNKTTFVTRGDLY